MKLTQRLIDASVVLTNPASFRNIDPSRYGLVADIRSRAQEVVNAAVIVDCDLARPQVEVLQCLRSRLQDFLVVTFVAAQDWLDAFSDAYNR